MDKRIKKTINKRISLLAAASIVIIVLETLVLSAFQLKSVMTDQSYELLQAEAEANADIIDSWIRDQSNVLLSMMDSLAYIDSLDEKTIMDYLELQLDRNPDALMYYVCLAYNKSVLPADHSELDLDPTTRGWWKAAVAKGGVIYTAPYVDFATGQMIVSIAAPFRLQGEQAVILADITIDHLLEIVGNISKDKDTSAFLLAEDGSVITHPNQAFLPNEDGNTILADEISIRLDEGKVTEFKDYDGSERYVAVGAVDANGWKVGVTRNKKTLSARIQGYTGSNMLKAGILAVVFIALLYFVLTKMLDPVNNIVNAIVHVSEGDFSVKVGQSSQKNEIGILQNTVRELTRTLSEIVGDANRILAEIAAYNLSSEDMKSYPGDFDRLSTSINSVKNILCSLLSEVQRASSGVQNGSTQLASAVDMLSQGSVTQADSIHDLTGDVENMAERISRSSENCKQASGMLQKLDSEIRVGNEAMSALLAAVTEIEQMSTDIQKVMGAIDDIASKTNILALNASVEAARAGEHGKGFAVVAEEIRSLAVNCANESKKTSELLEGCLHAIEETKKHADTTSEKLVEVEKNSSGISETFRVIAEEMEEQAKDSGSIRSGLQHISDVVHSNSAAAQQTSAASEELSNQAVSLTGMVKKFIV